MDLTDLEVLRYLHDAEVITLVYRLDADNYREFALTVICHPDAGCPKWDGKRIVIRLHDLIIANHVVFGAMTEREQINSWRSKLSPSIAAEVQRLAASGIGVAGHPFSVTFHSGSLLAGICQRILVEVDEPA